ncbi:MAG: hypothetical protein JW984_05920 [Deltaproteobacteria bacterium]|uniref:NAD glycohydrolase translocation F5/8 type C domain-containing protein n=1 Tax=Candidatus Zymogenus saltonus TaxID=2844893 RepID=A0A9D8PP95_9DELT|nr:hypothetical protein [Candidatus Zymogenus saltonus]
MKLLRSNRSGSGGFGGFLICKVTILFILALFLLPSISLSQEVEWELRSSSHLAPQGQNYYDVYRLFDGQMGTAWVEGVSGGGVGEFITLRLMNIAGNVENYIYLKGFELNNGYCKDRETWLKNGRVRKIKIYFNGTEIYNGHLEDTMREQTVSLGSHLVNIDDVIKIEIMDVFPGREYEDTAISELIPIYTFAQ